MYNAFFQLVITQLFNNGDCAVISDIVIELGGDTVYFDYYLSSLIALICTITVYVICCLCVWKVIRLFGRLWSRF